MFLRQMHDLDYSEISSYTIDNKQNVLEEYKLLRDTIFDSLTDIEKQYIESFMQRLYSTTIFDGKKCLCHNDFSCNHLLLDDNNRLCGIIDFGDSGIIDEYCDFIYLLEDSEEELGHEFGEDVLRLYGNINIQKAKEYGFVPKGRLFRHGSELDFALTRRLSAVLAQRRNPCFYRRSL